MTNKLVLLQDSAQAAIEAEMAAPAEQGRFSRLIEKISAVKQKINALPQFSQRSQIRGLGAAPWLVGFIGSILILNRFVSPIITKLAMTTLIAPVAALALVVLGEFDFTKLTAMISSNVGIVFATGGTIIVALFVQNVVKMALLTKSLVSESHKQYRTYALASMLTPVTTSALWYLATKLGYFLGAKSISLGIMAIFASGAIGEALKNVDPMNATTADLAAIATVMSDGLRWGLGFLIVIHLFFVFKSYGLVHKTLNYLFDLKTKKVVEEKWHTKAWEKVCDNWGKLTAISIIITFCTAFIVNLPTEEEAEAERLREAKLAEIQMKRQLEQALRVTCVGGVTYATENGHAYRLTNKDGSSHCVPPAVQKMAAIGAEFSVGKSYRREVIELDAGGYDKVCQEYGSHSDSTRVDTGEEKHSERQDLNGNCRIDITAKRNVRYWLELPEGLPKGVKMPPIDLEKK